MVSYNYCKAVSSIPFHEYFCLLKSPGECSGRHTSKGWHDLRKLKTADDSSL